jgi:hypothetical protein
VGVVGKIIAFFNTMNFPVFDGEKMYTNPIDGLVMSGQWFMNVRVGPTIKKIVDTAQIPKVKIMNEETRLCVMVCYYT